MSIEQVIARSRQPGEFKEKKHFTVAKDQAIQKMRKFALASPYNYIIELIQAANANGATYIDIQNEQRSVTLSYVGGGFAPDELAQLFDFLFASKDRLDLAALRQLALGVNALMVAKPHLLVIESGRGTLESTTRVAISGFGTSVDVGTPSAALDGTYIRADGLIRGLLGNVDPQERAVIERSCLTAPVPLLYNDEPLFGYRTMRIPKISGYERVVTFDEGDLFGAIGLTKSHTLASFKILTYGVWVQSLEHEFSQSARVGGVVSFNRLRKTADHASIVHDEVLEEMWLRIRPYVEQLLGGQSGAGTFNVRKLGDPQTMMPIHLRNLSASAPNIVAFPASAVSSPAHHELAEEFGEVLDAEVLVFERDSDRAAIELLVSGARLSFPELSADEIAFYRMPHATPPAPPWLTDEKPLTPVSKDEFMGALGEYESLPAVRAYVDALKADDVMSVTAYVPFEEPLRGRSVAQVRLAGRAVCTCAVGGTSGFCLAIDLPERERKALVSSVDVHHCVSLAEVVANVIAEVRAAELDPIVDAVVGETPWDSQSPNARTLVLSRIAAGIMIKFEEQDERVRVDLVKAPGASIASSSMPLFRGRDARRAIWEVEGVMDRSHGLVYAIADGHEAALEGIFLFDVLRVDELEEMYLIKMLGEASYVRLDHRDVLAEAGGFQVRDFALGVRDYPDHPLLVEGKGAWSDAIQDDLVEQLSLLAFRSRLETQVTDDLRRHARRHLSYFAITVPPEDDRLRIRKRPLFKTLDDRLASLVDIESFAQGHPSKRVLMADGWASDAATLADLSELQPWRPGTDLVLAPNPLLAHLLHRNDLLRFTAEPVDGSPDRQSLSITRSIYVGASDLEGALGFPSLPQAQPKITIFDVSAKQVFSLDGLAARYGVVGELFSTSPVANRLTEIEADFIERLERELLLMCQLVQDSRASHPRELEILLAYTAALVDVVAGSVRCDDVIAQRVLELPMFDSKHGIPFHARSLLNRYLREAPIGAPQRWLEELSDPTSEQVQWLKALCDRFVTKPTRPPTLQDPEPHVEALLDWARKAVQTLRVDIGKTPALVAYSGGATRDLIRPMVNDAELYINVDHWLVQKAIGKTKREARWLAMAIYAYLNDYWYEITNAHEVAFQAKMADELLDSTKRP